MAEQTSWTIPGDAALRAGGGFDASPGRRAVVVAAAGAFAVLVFVVAGLVVEHVPRDRNMDHYVPQAHGFHRAGTIAGTTYWVLPGPGDTIRLRTTGAQGHLCNYGGPSLDSPALAAVFGSGGDSLRVCTVGSPRQRTAVYLDRDQEGTAHLVAPDGTDVPETGAVDLSPQAPGGRLDVFTYPVDLGDLSGVAPTFR